MPTKVCYTSASSPHAPVAQLDRASASGAAQDESRSEPTPKNRGESGSALFHCGRSRPLNAAFRGIRCTALDMLINIARSIG
jgi:hypothetical protein